MQAAPWWRVSRCLSHQVCVSLGRCSGYSSPPQATGSSADNDNDWDVTPMEHWTHGMCVRWMRDEARWSEEESEVASEWLSGFVEPGRKLTLEKVREKITLSELSENSLEDFLKKYNNPGAKSILELF